MTVTRLLACLALVLTVAVPVASAEEAVHGSAVAAVPVEAEAAGEDVSANGDADLSDADRFCRSIADQARDLRYDYREERLNQLKAEVEASIARMDEKKAEFANWVKQREDFSNLATDTLIAIYGRMRPDAAAERLALVDTRLASAILLRMSTNNSGVILNEMASDKAAAITTIMAQSADTGEGT